MDDFDKRKRSALQALVNACEHDKSPKGSVDEPIQELVDLLNAQADYATTSSCSGRISLFHTTGSETTMKGTGKWLLALHRTLADASELKNTLSQGLSLYPEAPSMTIFKHEPFVLHVMCRTVEHAQALLKIAMDAGFRESGISVGAKKIMVGVRTTANVLECPVAVDGRLVCSNDYLDFIAEEANRRFIENHRRTRHFESLVQDHFPQSMKQDGASAEESMDEPNLSLAHWSLLEAPFQLRRWGHTATIIGAGKILVFGGWGEADVSAEKQHHAHLAHALILEACKSDHLFVRVPESKQEPLARAYHTTINLDEEWSIVFGGRRSPQSPLSDFWAFHSTTEQWHLVHSISENVPSLAARWRHAAVAMSERRMFIYGGRSLETVFDELWSVRFTEGSSGSLELSSLEKIPSRGTTPGPRFAHAMIANPKNDTILVHGGLQDVQAGDGPAEIFIFDISTAMWSSVRLPALNWRFSHCWVPFGSMESLIVGGLGKDYSRDDLQAGRALRVRLDGPTVPPSCDIVTFAAHGRLDSLLAVQFPLLNTCNSSVYILGGGATCFAFGSVFGSCARLDFTNPEVGNGKTMDAILDTLAFETSKANAVQVKQSLNEMQAMDKTRKVVVTAQAIQFPILKQVEQAVISKLGGFGEVKIVAPNSVIVAKPASGKSVEQRKEEVIRRVFQKKRCKIEKVDDVLLVHSREVTEGDVQNVSSQDWHELLLQFPGTTRVVWGAEVDEGPMRQSRNRLVHVSSLSGEVRDVKEECWITVHENGIIYTYDMLRCMYSKGNVAEKLRFGQLIQPGEIVVDLFAGIGYFTVPALKITKNARIVHACEWNPDALRALRRNLTMNHVGAGRCVVHPGDCRGFKLPANERAHRISLGLIPSSEVAWPTAVSCLSEHGGWLHIHGNAPETEIETFGIRVEERIQEICRRLKGIDWIAMCVHVQKVKSYAPRVLHLVADVKCGPRTNGLVSPEFMSSVSMADRKIFNAAPKSKKSFQRSKAAEGLREELRHFSDQLLCVSSVSELSLEDARVLAADGQLMMKRASDHLRDTHPLDG